MNYHQVLGTRNTIALWAERDQILAEADRIDDDMRQAIRQAAAKLKLCAEIVTINGPREAMSGKNGGAIPLVISKNQSNY